MKRILYLLLAGSFLLNIQIAQATGGFSGCHAPCDTGPGSSQRSFTRTYKKPINYANSKRAKRTEDVIISYNDFQNHLTVGNSRILSTVQEGAVTPMDVGIIDTVGDVFQTWVMPDLNDYTTNLFNMSHQGLETTSFTDSFPNPTHVIYGEESDRNEFYQLTQDDLFFYGYEESEMVNGNPFALDVYTALTPVPLKWGLEYTGVVSFVDEQNSTPFDSIRYVQLYDVIGQGTLVTFDDGSVSAVKLIFTEEEYSYKDGVETFEGSEDELVWYSKEGHYIRAEIEDAFTDTGMVNLTNMSYQKITNVTTGIFSNTSSTNVNSFPNPVSAGDVLNFEIDVPLLSSTVKIFSTQGKQVTQLGFSSMNQIKVPETLASGIYFYLVQTPDGDNIYSGKVQIQ